MAKAYEKGIAAAQAAVIGQVAERTEPRTRSEIESFIKGFGLSTAAARRIVDEWDADQTRSYRAGHDAGWDDAYSSYLA